MPARTNLLSVVALIGSVCLGAAPPASAQSAAEVAAARAHFRKARQLEEKQDWAAAVEELRAALAVKETPGLRYHLAYCQEQLTDYAAALLDYERAKQLLAEGQQAADVSKLLGPAIERVTALVGEITLISPDGGAYEVFLDGNRVELGETLRVDPGVHRVRALREGKEQHHEVVVAAQGQYRVELRRPAPAKEPVPSSPAVPVDTAPAPEPKASLKLPVLIAEGLVTAAGLGVGFGFTLRANHASSEADRALAEIDAQDPEARCSSKQSGVRSACAQLSDFKQQEFNARHTATLGFVAAGAGAALFVATWLFWPEETAVSARSGKPGVLTSFDGRRGFVGVFSEF